MIRCLRRINYIDKGAAVRAAGYLLRNYETLQLLLPENVPIQPNELLKLRALLGELPRLADARWLRNVDLAYTENADYISMLFRDSLDLLRRRRVDKPLTYLLDTPRSPTDLERLHHRLAQEWFDGTMLSE